MLSLTALLLVLSTTACTPIGFVAEVIGGGERERAVKAQYLGLQNQRVAVLAAADEYTLFQHPDAPARVVAAVTREIAEQVPGVRVVDPKQVMQYQESDPYWIARRYSTLLETFDVSRVVIIDLSDYRTHEPGNAHVWQGVINASVGVVEAEDEDPDDYAFSYRRPVPLFPPNSKIGVLNSDDATIELGMQKTFARDVGRLFYNHKVKQ